LSLTASGLVVSYQKQEGSGTRINLSTGETVSNGVLTVSANQLASVSSGLLTYICNISYTDPDVGVALTNEASLSYSLISMASELKYASISGETTFLYDASRTIVGSGEITLTAETTNVSVVQWQYKQSNGTFAAFPTTNNSYINTNELVVAHNESGIWLNDKIAIIKLVTSDPNVYDIIQINKIFDGVSGDSSLVAALSNENHVLPVDANGTVKSWVGSPTEIHVYEGANDVTSQWTISVVPG